MCFTITHSHSHTALFYYTVNRYICEYIDKYMYIHSINSMQSFFLYSHRLMNMSGVMLGSVSYQRTLQLTDDHTADLQVKR